MNRNRPLPVVIVGGGPTGLLLAISLLNFRIRCKVLEKRPVIGNHSRSLGIHPVSLELFDRLGIAAPFIENGLKIFRGHAFMDRRRVGGIRFEEYCPAPWNFILSLPQYRTEEILERELLRIDPDCLERGAVVNRIDESEEGVSIDYRSPSGEKSLNGKWVVGCDGIESVTRRSAAIRISEKRYPDTYVMGDFSENTTLGNDAAIYLHRDGVVESFPLPGGWRRWVVKTGNYVADPDRDLLQRLVYKRLGIDLSETENCMLSGFGTHQLLAHSLFNRRTLLAGDAGHVVSPIGGQGMNLGWLSARDLADSLKKTEERPEEAGLILNQYSVRRRRVARQAGRRAELNMILGRRQSVPALREVLVRSLVRTPLQHLTARLFTMRGLGRWPL